MGNIAEMLAPGFRGGAIECQTNSTTTDPRYHGNKIWDKNGYNLACIRDISEIFACSRGFWGHAIEQRQSIFTTTDQVAMETKF